ncbi:hypothetical protein DFH09DRAFT_1292970 [Mycena vulgaris]|nr:hypothetical protein DFH09DRAFT_1292970 [Mycena vulgaris]
MRIEDAQTQRRARAKGGVASEIHQVRTRGGENAEDDNWSTLPLRRRERSSYPNRIMRRIGLIATRAMLAVLSMCGHGSEPEGCARMEVRWIRAGKVGTQERIRQGDSSRGTETNAQEGGAAGRRSESSAWNRGRGACGTTAQAGINAPRHVMHARRAAVGWAETDSSGYGREGAESFSENEIDDPACKAPGVAQQPWRSGF